MNPKTFDAEYWLERATEARALADNMVTVEAQRELLDIAAKYERLAEWHGAATKARKLIDGSAFGPEALMAIGHAFDEAWQEIATTFGNHPHSIEAARMQLANA